MRKILRIELIILLAVLTSIVSSCSKAKDDEPEKPGNANVISRTYSVAAWSSNSSRWYTHLSVPEITLDNINSASIQVYFGIVNNNWIALPTTVVASTDYYMGYLTTVGIVEIRWDYNGIGIGSDPNTFYSATAKFKVVIIPPAMMRVNPNLDLKNYNAVKAKLNLKD